MHPDPAYGTFLGDYLAIKGFTITQSETNVENFYGIHKTRTDLIIMSKESPYLDAMGFLIKKRNSEKVEDIPIFMIGDFSPKEIHTFKEFHVEAFLSKKINPQALHDRINQQFFLQNPPPEKKTPMLVDIHSHHQNLIIQIEGNLELDKIIVLNHRIRMFFREKDCLIPRVLFIIPHLYPDNVTQQSVSLLFKFLLSKELKLQDGKIVVLTKNTTFLEVLRSLKHLDLVKVVDNYYEGFQTLIAEVDPFTKVPVDFMKEGNVYSLDLFDMAGKIRLKAQRPVTKAFLDSLRDEKIRHLKYYGKAKLALATVDTQESTSMEDIIDQECQDQINVKDGCIEILDNADDAFALMDTSVMDYITREFNSVSSELFDETSVNEKQNLFFNSVKGETLLFVSLNHMLFEMVQQSLSMYFSIENVHAKENIKPILDQGRFAIIFIDLTIPHDTVLRILQVIRLRSNKAKTTIILMGKTITKQELLNYKRCGTDHIILQPFTTEKFFSKVYQAVTIDRGL